MTWTGPLLTVAVILAVSALAGLYLTRTVRYLIAGLQALADAHVLLGRSLDALDTRLTAIEREHEPDSGITIPSWFCRHCTTMMLMDDALHGRCTREPRDPACPLPPN
jgi:hypothetical protein